MFEDVTHTANNESIDGPEKYVVVKYKILNRSMDCSEEKSHEGNVNMAYVSFSLIAKKILH